MFIVKLTNKKKLKKKMIFLNFLFSFVFSVSDQPCYVNYTYRNCPICMPRDNNNCGFCVNIQQCDVGDENGPFNIQCLPGMWIKRKDTCTNDMCLIAKEKKYCVFPCIWRVSKCVLSRDVSIETEKEKQNVDTFLTTKQLLMYCFIIFLVFCVIFSIYSDCYNRKPFYTSLPNLENGISHDDLPPPSLTGN